MMKNHNLLMNSIVLILALVFAFAIAFTTCSNPAGFVGGTGTPDTAWYDNAAPGQTEFTISTADKLAGLAVIVNGFSSFSGKTVKLLSNISLSVYGAGKDFNDGMGWIPIGGSFSFFNGKFDGNGKTITGLSINDAPSKYQGLFSTIYSGGEVKNLTLNDVNIYCTSDYIGGVVGYLMGYATVKNCVALNYSISGTGNIGRVIGSSYLFGGVLNSYGKSDIPGGPWTPGGNNGTDISPSGAENTKEWWVNGATDDPPGPGFDFENVWKMSGGENSLPVFK